MTASIPKIRFLLDRVVYSLIILLKLSIASPQATTFKNIPGYVTHLAFFQKMTTHHVKVKILTWLLKKISITDDVGIKEGIELSILFLVALRANCVV
jgi:hypothetical protein